MNIHALQTTIQIPKIRSGYRNAVYWLAANPEQWLSNPAAANMVLDLYDVTNKKLLADIRTAAKHIHHLPQQKG